jgi:hypothetical protein
LGASAIRWIVGWFRAQGAPAQLTNQLST